MLEAGIPEIVPSVAMSWSGMHSSLWGGWQLIPGVAMSSEAFLEALCGGVTARLVRVETHSMRTWASSDAS